MKNKWLAAFLNVIPGLGYLYLETRTPFAVLLISFLPVTIVLSAIGAAIDPTWANSGADDVYRGWDAIMLLPVLIPFMVDAFFETGRVNTLRMAKQTKKQAAKSSR